MKNRFIFLIILLNDILINCKLYSLMKSNFKEKVNIHSNANANLKTNFNTFKKSFKNEYKNEINKIQENNKNISKNINDMSIKKYKVNQNEHCLLPYNENQDECFMCHMGYHLNSNYICQCDLNRGCSKCENGECIQCSLGLELNKDKNCECISNKNFCKTCSVNKQICLNCFTGYKYEFNKCVPSPIHGCKEVEFKNNNYYCKSCRNGLVFQNDSCICLNNVGSCEECSKGNYDSICLKCKKGYINYKKGCKCSIKNSCSKCDENDICLEYLSDDNN